MFDENAFIKQNLSFINNFCNKSHAKLEEDEKFSACLDGFLHSMRVYNNNCGSYKEFASICMKKAIQRQEESLKKQKLAERYNFSLDRVFKTEESQCTPAEFIADKNGDFTNKTIFKLSLDELSESELKLCWLLQQGYSHDEAQKILNLNNDSFTDLLERLRCNLALKI